MNLSVEPSRQRSYHYPYSPVDAWDGECEMAKRGFKPLSKGKLRSNNKRNYFFVYLWATQEEYEAAAEVTQSGTIAMCISDTLVSDDGETAVNPKLGELHFVSGTWDVNTVAHECLHAVLHRMRYLQPGPALVLDEMRDGYDPEHEEVIAYEMGSWVEACMSWLANLDPKSPYPKSTFDR